MDQDILGQVTAWAQHNTASAGCLIALFVMFIIYCFSASRTGIIFKMFMLLAMGLVAYFPVHQLWASFWSSGATALFGKSVGTIAGFLALAWFFNDMMDTRPPYPYDDRYPDDRRGGYGRYDDRFRRR